MATEISDVSREINQHDLGTAHKLEAQRIRNTEYTLAYQRRGKDLVDQQRHTLLPSQVIPTGVGTSYWNRTNRYRFSLPSAMASQRSSNFVFCAEASSRNLMDPIWRYSMPQDRISSTPKRLSGADKRFADFHYTFEPTGLPIDCITPNNIPVNQGPQ